MRIQLVSNLFPPHVIGGYEIGCLRFARAAKQAGHQVQVLTSLATGRLRKRSEAVDLDVQPIFAPVYNYESVLSDVPADLDPAAFGGIIPANCIALEHQITEFRPDAIWIQNPLGLGPVGILETAAASGVSTALQLGDHLDGTVADHQIGFNVLPRWIRAKAKVGGIAVSQKTLERNEIHGRFGRSIVVANGVSIQSGCEPVHSLSESKLNLIYFGQVERHKGLLQLVEAFALLHSKVSQEVALHIAGTGSEVFANELRQRIADCGVRDSVQLHGFCEPQALRELLDSMHIAVFPLSADEPFAFVVIEALQAGLSTVVSKEAGVAEFLPQDYPFFIQDRNEPAQIADVLEQLISDKTAAYEWCHLLQEAVLENCDLDRKCLPRCLRFLREGSRNFEASFFSPQVGYQTSLRNTRIEDGLSNWYAVRHLENVLEDYRQAQRQALTVVSKSSPGRKLERWIRKRIPKDMRQAMKERLRLAPSKLAG